MYKGKGPTKLILIERLGAEKIEIERLTMAKLERDGSAAVEYEGEARGGGKLRPDRSLSLRKNVEPRIKTLRHRTISEEAPRVSACPRRTTGVRARIPTTGR